VLKRKEKQVNRKYFTQWFWIPHYKILGRPPVLVYLGRHAHIDSSYIIHVDGYQILPLLTKLFNCR